MVNSKPLPLRVKALCKHNTHNGHRDRDCNQFNDQVTLTVHTNTG